MHAADRLPIVGVAGVDSEIVDLRPQFYERFVADASSAADLLRTKLTGATDPRVRQDLEIMIKSQDDAAKHFGKAGLDAIAKEVDFKKQIVLVFAWQGSGGDKLDYAILESFPEQIPFSLKPGRSAICRVAI